MRPTLKILSCLLVVNCNFLMASSSIGMVELKQNINASPAFRATQSVLSENSDILGRSVEVHSTEDALRAATAKILKSELNGVQESTANVEIAVPAQPPQVNTQRPVLNQDNFNVNEPNINNNNNDSYPKFNFNFVNEELLKEQPLAETQPSIKQVETLTVVEPKPTEAIIGTIPDSSIQIEQPHAHQHQHQHQHAHAHAQSYITNAPKEETHHYLPKISEAAHIPNTEPQNDRSTVTSNQPANIQNPGQIKTQGDILPEQPKSPEQHEVDTNHTPKPQHSGFKNFMSEGLSNLNSFAKEITTDVAPALRSRLRNDLVGYDFKALKELNTQHEEELKHQHHHMHHQQLDHGVQQHQHAQNFEMHQPEPHHYQHHHHHIEHEHANKTAEPAHIHIQHAPIQHPHPHQPHLQHEHQVSQHVKEHHRPVQLSHNHNQYYPPIYQAQRYSPPPYGYYTPLPPPQARPIRYNPPRTYRQNQKYSSLYHPIVPASSLYAEPEREVFIPVAHGAFNEQNDPLLNWFRAKNNKSRSQKRKAHKSSFYTSPYQNMTIAEQLMKRKGKFMYPQLMLNDFGLDSPPPPPEKGSIVSYGFTL